MRRIGVTLAWGSCGPLLGCYEGPPPGDPASLGHEDGASTGSPSPSHATSWPPADSGPPELSTGGLETSTGVGSSGGDESTGTGKSSPAHPSTDEPASPAFFEALEFGPANEDCHSRGIRVGPNDGWRSTIADAVSGDEILLEAGTYALDSALALPPGVAVYAYDCQAATIEVDRNTPGTGLAVEFSTDNVVAGITIEGPNTEGIMRFDDRHRDIVVRNCNLLGGQNDAIRFSGAAANVRFEGNFINSGPAQPGGVTSSSGGHLVYLSGDPGASDVVFYRNKLQGDYFGDARAGDDVLAVQAARRLVVEQNWVTRQFNIENIVDIKTTTAADDDGDVLIRGNLFSEGCLGTRGGQDGNPGGHGSALTFGDSVQDHAQLPVHVFELNRVEIGTGQCSKYFNIGQSRHSSLRMERNVFISDNSAAPDGGQSRNMHDVTIANNTFYRGAVMKLSDSSGALFDDGRGLRIVANVFYRANVNDRSGIGDDNDHEVSNNLWFMMASGIDGGVHSGNLDEDPMFVSDDADTLDLRLRPGSPAVGAGPRGGDLGAYAED